MKRLNALNLAPGFVALMDQGPLAAERRIAGTSPSMFFEQASFQQQVSASKWRITR
jgi:hypothetical protein